MVKKSYFRFFSGYYNLLLAFLFALFILRPYDRGVIYQGVWKFILIAVLVAAIFNCKHSKRIKCLVTVLAIPVVLFSWTNLFIRTDIIFVLKAMSTILFMLISTASIIHDVVLRARVTFETLRGVVCAYFMVAFAFAYAYYLIEYIHPGSMHIANKEISVLTYSHYLSVMLYFSFITLLTIGFGDIVAVSDVGQTVAVIEGIIGQFYIAILVARLVSVYSFLSDKRLLRVLEKDISKM